MTQPLIRSIQIDTDDLKLELDTQYVQLTDVGNPNGVATLDSSGKIPQTQVPAIAITDTSVVASQAAMLALTAQTGDIAIRTDVNKSFILSGTDPAVLGDWQELLTPPTTVLSVNGQTGAVVLSASDVNAVSDTGGTITGSLNVTSSLTVGGFSVAQVAGVLVNGNVVKADANGRLVDGGQGGAFPSGTTMVFYQAAAPTGWTQVTTNLSGRTLRVVNDGTGSATGGGVGGTHNINSPPSTAHTHTLSAHTHLHNHTHNVTVTVPAHNHRLPFGMVAAGVGNIHFNKTPIFGSSGTFTQTTFSNATAQSGTFSAALSDTASSTSSSVSTGGANVSSTGGPSTNSTNSTGPVAFAPKYIDVIVCSKD